MKIISDDIWQAETDAVVVPCNSRGVTLGFMYHAVGRYPALLHVYKRMAFQYPGALAGGVVGVYVTPALLPSALFLMATKEDPLDDSDLVFVKRAIPALNELIAARGIRTLAIPAIGCSDGQPMEPLCEILQAVKAEVTIYRGGIGPTVDIVREASGRLVMRAAEA